MWHNSLATRWRYALGLVLSLILFVVALNNAVYVIWRSAFATSNLHSIEIALLLYSLLGVVALIAGAFCVWRLFSKDKVGK